MPKLKFKKWRNRIEPGTVVSQDCTQERPVPTVDGPSNSMATSTSTTIPVPARKTLFSRFIKAVSKVTQDEFNKVLTKFSGCVEEAVKEVFVPAFQWSMEQSLSSRRSSEIMSSSPHGVERGETHASPSERSSHSQKPDLEIRSCSSSIGSACSLGLTATSSFTSGKKSRLNETSKTREDLKCGFKFLTMVGEVSTAALSSEPLRDLFIITKDSFFEDVHSEVTSSLTNVVFPKMMICLSRKTTSNLTNEILDHSLIKINSTLTELYRVETARLIGSSQPSSQSSRSYEDGTTVHWLNGEGEDGLPINVLSFMATTIPEVTSSVIYKSLQLQESLRLEPCPNRILETIICRNSGCESLNLSTRPSYHKKLESSMFAAASDFVRAVTGQIKVSFEEALKLADPSTDTALNTEQVRMASEKVLQSVQAIVKDVFVGNLFMRAQAAMTPLDAEELSCSLMSESKVVLKKIIENMAARLPLFSFWGSVQALTGQFLQSVEGDLDLLFMWQVSNSYVRHPEALSDLTVTDVFKMFADELRSGEAFQQKEASSEPVLKTLDRELVHKLLEDLMLQGNVQRTAEVASDVVDHVVASTSAALFMTSGCTNNEEYGNKRTSKKTLRFPKIKFPKVKMPKLRFKKWRNRIEPGTVVSQDCTQERPVPTVDGPSNSMATSTSTTIPVPARKTLFSRFIKAVSKVFRK
ncbi:hypothetical protein SRHO_G00097740 [Serrasalmus rhombeus]